MRTWAIGDVQGCFAELELLLSKLNLSSEDRLWFAGDLVNRGPGSLETLRLVRSLGEQAETVLGNHDLHLLAILFGDHQARRSDTFDALLSADDAEDIGHWLRRQPLLVYDEELDATMAHAGVPPFWSPEEAAERAQEVQDCLSGDNFQAFLRVMYGDEPDCWHEDLEGLDRIRIITNYFTRMRMIAADGRLDFTHKVGLEGAPAGFEPWFDAFARAQPGVKLVFGHWASLEGETGHPSLLATDTGCVYGRQLTAVCVASGERVSVAAV